MALVRKWWARASQSAYTVEMGITSHGAGHAKNVVGVWDADANAYYFEFDDSLISDNPDLAQYDPTSLYSIWDNSAEVVNKIEFGSLREAIGRETHEAATAVHGITGDVVGTSDSQTLTNKTIDGDDNTLQDIPGTALKDNTNLSPVGIKPSAADSVLHIKSSDASTVEMKVMNAAKTVDRTLKITCNDLELLNDAAAAVYLTGIAEPVDSDGAVPKSITDALDTRLTALERSDAFSSPTVHCLATTPDYGFYLIRINFFMESTANEDAVRRYEVYWSRSSFEWLSAGTISDTDLARLRGQAEGQVRIDGGTGNWYMLNTRHPLYVIAVAFDWDSPINQYVSAQDFARPVVPGDRRDSDGELIRAADLTQPGHLTIAGGATGNAAAAVTEWTQDSSSSKILKLSTSYRHRDENKAIRISFFGKSGLASGDDAYLIAEIQDRSGTVIKSQSFLIDHDTYGTYPTTPQEIQLNIESGLTAGVVYYLRLYQQNVKSTSYSSNIESNVYIDTLTNIPVI